MPSGQQAHLQERFTVNQEGASQSNSIGDPFLQTTWRDPDFAPAQQTLDCVRMLETPLSRWLACDAKAYRLKLPAELVHPILRAPA